MLSQRDHVKRMAQLATLTESCMTNDDVFVSLVVQRDGSMTHATNMDRVSVIRVLREYADRMEKVN